MPRAPKNENDETNENENDEAAPNGEKESPEDKFKRVAGKRVMTARRALETIAAAGRSSIMVNTDEQADKIMTALREDLEKVEVALHTDKTKGTRAPSETFEL